MIMTSKEKALLKLTISVLYLLFALALIVYVVGYFSE